MEIYYCWVSPIWTLILLLILLLKSFYLVGTWNFLKSKILVYMGGIDFSIEESFHTSSGVGIGGL
jgi:hypothetical protein